MWWKRLVRRCGINCLVNFSYNEKFVINREFLHLNISLPSHKMEESAKNAKLILVEKLTAKPKNEEELKLYPTNLAKGLTILRQLCMSTINTMDDKMKALSLLIKVAPDEGQDMLCRWRDSMNFLRGDDVKNMVDLLIEVTKSSQIPSHERIVTATNLYNLCYFEFCYDCFANLAVLPEILVEHRIEAARFLFMSEPHKEIAQNTLLEVIETMAYPSQYRYKIIAGFISRTGINSSLNFTKLKIGYDEDFVYGLQTNFFYNDGNDVRDRILSGQHMLQMDCVDEKEKDDIVDILFQFASDTTLTNNARADAADVVLREGKDEDRIKARTIITDLGFSAVNTRLEGSLLDRSKTIYNDAENIHAFTDQINRFIEKIINETSITVRPYSDIHAEVTDLVRKHTGESKDNTQRFRAYKALNRISVDTARFTTYKVTLAEIFVHTWIRIQQYEGEQLEELEKALVEELIDMGDTCSSGHSGRFVNILSRVDDTLKISWDDQIKANVAGRMNARIRDCPDEELRASLAMANSEMAEEEDKENYMKFIQEQLPLLREELHKEFVDEGYISIKEFDRAFELSVADWI